MVDLNLALHSAYYLARQFKYRENTQSHHASKINTKAIFLFIFQLRWWVANFSSVHLQTSVTVLPERLLFCVVLWSFCSFFFHSIWSCSHVFSYTAIWWTLSATIHFPCFQCLCYSHIGCLMQYDFSVFKQMMLNVVLCVMYEFIWQQHDCMNT